MDMRAESSLELTDSAINIVQIVYSQFIEYTYALPAGWNMISLPLTVDDLSLEAIFRKQFHCSDSKVGTFQPADSKLLQGIGLTCRIRPRSRFRERFTPTAQRIFAVVGVWSDRATVR